MSVRAETEQYNCQNKTSRHPSGISPAHNRMTYTTNSTPSSIVHCTLQQHETLE